MADSEKVYNMRFSKIYPLLIAKAVKKGRSAQEVDEVTSWFDAGNTLFG